MTAPTERRRQAERRGKTEEDLLDAAADLIARLGVERASLADIGERAGVSRGLPNHRFGSKSALVARLAERSQGRMLSHLNSTVAKAQSGDSGDRSAGTGLGSLLMMIDTYLEMFADPTPDQRALIVMWGSTFPSDARIGGMLEADRRSYESLSQQVTAGQEDGSIRADVDPVGSAVLLLALIRGLASLQLTDGQITDMSGVRPMCREWIRISLEAIALPQ